MKKYLDMAYEKNIERIRYDPFSFIAHRMG